MSLPGVCGEACVVVDLKERAMKLVTTLKVRPTLSTVGPFLEPLFGITVLTSHRPEPVAKSAIAGLKIRAPLQPRSCPEGKVRMHNNF